MRPPTICRARRTPATPPPPLMAHSCLVFCFVLFCGSLTVTTNVSILAKVDCYHQRIRSENVVSRIGRMHAISASVFKSQRPKRSVNSPSSSCLLSHTTKVSIRRDGPMQPAIDSSTPLDVEFDCDDLTYTIDYDKERGVVPDQTAVGDVNNAKHTGFEKILQEDEDGILPLDSSVIAKKPQHTGFEKILQEDEDGAFLLDSSAIAKKRSFLPLPAVLAAVLFGVLMFFLTTTHRDSSAPSALTLSQASLMDLPRDLPVMPPSPPAPPPLPPFPPPLLCLGEIHLSIRLKTIVEYNVENVGTWGGTCTCPDGNSYQVGDNRDACHTLACAGGTISDCTKHKDKVCPHRGWSHETLGESRGVGCIGRLWCGVVM